MIMIPPRNYATPQAYVTDLCEQLDAGFFSGDLVETCDLTELKDYIARWSTRIKEYEQH